MVKTAALAVAALLTISATAHAQITGSVTYIHGSAGNALSDPRPCFFLQMNNQNIWYAIPYADPGGPTNIETIKLAFIAGRSDVTLYPGNLLPECSSVTSVAAIGLGTVK